MNYWTVFQCSEKQFTKPSTTTQYRVFLEGLIFNYYDDLEALGTTVALYSGSCIEQMVQNE